MSEIDPFVFLSVDSLAAFLRVPKVDLLDYLYKSRSRYVTYAVQKKSGGVRTISVPDFFLKNIQSRIKILLESVYEHRSCVHGFVAGKSIVTNAEKHVGKPCVLNIDLEDFFGSVTFQRVRGLFIAAPYGMNSSVATVIAHAACYQGSLPQGSPCSPIIANMVAAILDSKLLRIAKRYGMVYTRYADDITFSHVREISSDCIVHIGGEWKGGIIDAIVASGFRPNQAKIKLSRRGNRREVTGVIANEKLNVRRDYIDKTRCALTAWEKHGFEAANRVFHEKYPGKRCEVDVFIAGRLAHIGNVRGKGDYLFCKLMRRYAQLAGFDYECQVSSLESIDSSLFLLLDNDGLECGTAFLLKGYGLVTCAHAADAAVHCVHWKKRDKKYLFDVVRRNVVADVAMLKPLGLNCRQHYWLSISENLQPAPHAVCSFSGFPNPNGIDGPSHYSCNIVSYTVRGGIDHFKISQIVIGGASGSPLLDAQKKVIGIVVRGLGGDGPDAGNVDNNLAVSIKYIKE